MNSDISDPNFYRPAGAPIAPSTDNSRCPTCNRPTTTKPVRKCAECGKGMGNHDKYFFRKDGRIQHKNCADPTSWAVI